MKNARRSAGRCGKREIDASHQFYATAVPISSDPLSRLLDCLQGVRQTGPDTYIALCPTHPDRNPSLSIRITPDGVILVHDYGGCATADVVADVGLELRDLFPPRPDHHQPPKSPSERRRYGQALDALRALARESLIVLVAAENLAVGRTLTAEDLERLRLAEHRIRAAREIAA